MAGKKQPPKKNPEKKNSAATSAAAPTFGAGPGFKTWALALLVVLITGIVFSGVTKLKWTNWDDDEYVYENEMVMRGDYKAIFNTPVNNNYNPLPVAMHAWEWSLVQDDPRLYHINNLWMHLVCTLLVFWLMKMLGLQPLWAAFAALLFGIHPLRVESVAWITERKDVLFGMLYVGALITYVKYLDSKKWVWIGLAAVLFTLSLLSKIQAVSLPLAMLAIDWYRGRKWGWMVLVEKLPFFIGSVVVGLIGVYFLRQGGTLDATESFGLAQRVPLGLTAYLIYVVKAVIPYETCTFYPYPAQVGILYYLGMTGALVVMGVAVLLRKLSRETTFGMAFFTVNIMFLLQIVGAGSAYRADRFTYIAYIGLFFMLAMVAQRLAAKRTTLVVVGVAAGILVMGSMAATLRYIPVWKNSDTLWTDVIEKYPQKVPLAYVNRGQYLRREKQTDRAFADFNMAIQLKPTYHLSYLNRGNIYFDRGENDAALSDYTKVITLLSPIDTTKRVDVAIPSALSNRGAIYSRKGMQAEALADFRLALKFNPKDKNTWNNRGLTYFNMGDYTRAIPDFTEFLKLDSASAGVINLRGFSYLQLRKFPEALADFNAAIAKDPKDGNFYLNRAYAQFSLGNRAAGDADIAQAQAMGVPVDTAFVARLR